MLLCNLGVLVRRLMPYRVEFPMHDDFSFEKMQA